MFLKGQFQICYVTHSLDAAVDIFNKQYKVGTFRRFGGSALKVSTQTGDDEMVVKTAIAQIDEMTLEIIEPISCAVDFYRGFIDATAPMRLHHIGMIATDIENIRRESEAMGRQAVLWGQYAGGRFVYVDARATLGHYLEYVVKDS
jgi:hypothetical protein